MNDYALRFPVPVPGNLSQLEFTWQNLRPQQSLKYRIEMTVDNPEAMQPPSLDIPSTGESGDQMLDGAVTLTHVFRHEKSHRVRIISRPPARVVAVVVRRFPLMHRDYER